MGKKLKLDVDGLRVESYATGDTARGCGTIRAQELPVEAAIAVTRTNCLTTPCCPDTLTCPTA
jgi:hypothetical protein